MSDHEAGQPKPTNGPSTPGTKMAESIVLTVDDNGLGKRILIDGEEFPWFISADIQVNLIAGASFKSVTATIYSDDIRIVRDDEVTPAADPVSHLSSLRLGSNGMTPCCGLPVNELPNTDRMTLVPGQVTCPAATTGYATTAGQHSRSCVEWKHYHGIYCHPTCPTCSGRTLPTEGTAS